MKIILFLLFFNFIHVVFTNYFTKTINMPMYNCKLCKFHSIVLVKMNEFNNNDTIYKNLYVIEFFPCENYMDIKVVIKMLLGKSLPGKVQVYYFDKIDKNSLIKKYNKINKHPISTESIKKINKQLYKLIKSWKTSYQLYKRNCQSFCYYITKNNCK